MSNQIAESVERELHPSHARAEDGYPELSERDRQKNTQVTRSTDFMSDLIDAQHHLIKAQHEFLHDNDTRALATAQRNFIVTQNHVLDRLGLYA